MKFLKSKAVKFLTIIIIIVILSFLTIDKKIYNDFISTKISNLINKSKIPILVDSPKLFFKGIKSDNVSINIPFFNILLLTRLSNCVVKPKLLSFLSDNYKIFFNANAYEGNIHGEINYTPSSNSEYSIEIKDVNTSLHPQLASVNIKGGVLNIKASNIKNNLKRNIPINGYVNFNLQSLTIPLTSGIIKSMIPLDLKEDLKNASISLNAQFSESKIVIESLNFDSNLLKLNGSGELSLFELNSDRLRGMLFNVNIAMSEKFTKTISPSLIIPALTAARHRVNGKLSDNTKSFSAKISGSLNSLFIDIKDTSSNIRGVNN